MPQIAPGCWERLYVSVISAGNQLRLHGVYAFRGGLKQDGVHTADGEREREKK